MTKKSLTFNDAPIRNSKPKNIFNSGIINANTIVAKKCISTPQAHIANLKISHHPIQETSYVENLSNNLIIKTNNNIDSINIKKDGDVAINTNLDVDGNFKTWDGNFIGDINATNANLLGDIISTNSKVTNNSEILGLVTASDAHIHRDIHVDGLTIAREVHSQNMFANNILKSKSIECDLIGSQANLVITAGLNHVISVQNIRYNVLLLNTTIIDPLAIKSCKIFLINHNTILQADETCNGIEIIVYNNNTVGNVVVRDSLNIIENLCSCTAVKIVYLAQINSWIKI